MLTLYDSQTDKMLLSRIASVPHTSTRSKIFICLAYELVKSEHSNRIC